jgi:ribonuclease M5
MEKIKIYVVEGTHDEAHLKQIFKNIHTISVGGSSVNDEVVKFLIENQDNMEIYLLFDPDYPGEKIRHKVASKLNKYHHIFIDKDIAKNKRKTGIEHVDKKHLIEAIGLHHTFQIQNTLDYHSFIECGLTGVEHSKKLRIYLAKKLNLGNPNAKTLFNRLNMIGITKEKLKEMLNEAPI